MGLTKSNEDHEVPFSQFFQIKSSCTTVFIMRVLDIDL